MLDRIAVAVLSVAIAAVSHAALRPCDAHIPQGVERSIVVDAPLESDCATITIVINIVEAD